MRGPDAAEVKAAGRLSELVGRSVAFDMRRSNAGRGEFWACCPFHGEKTASFKVDDRKGFFICFGCGAKGDVFDWAQQQLGARDFREAVGMVAEAFGVLAASLHGERGNQAAERAARERARAAALAAREREAARDAATGLRRAAELWRAARRDLPVLRDYLEARGVDTETVWRACNGAPIWLRGHPDLPYFERQGSGPARVVHSGPAMIGLVSSPGRDVGVHRTWITASGRARVGGRKLDKRWLGATGAMKGRPVRITAHTSRMIVGEGIETTLAAWAMLRAAGEVWSAEAALSRDALCGAGDPAFDGPGLTRAGKPLPSAVPDWSRPGWLAPDYVDELVVLAEGSSKEPDVARRLTERAVRRHAFRRDGRARACRMSLPGGRWDTDLDFADIVQRERV